MDLNSEALPKKKLKVRIIRKQETKVKNEPIFDNDSPKSESISEVFPKKKLKVRIIRKQETKVKNEPIFDNDSPKEEAKSENNEKTNSDTTQIDREPPKAEEYDLPSRKAKKKGRVTATSNVCLPSVEIPQDLWVDNNEDVVGIIYMLTCVETGLSYIGRTLSHRARLGRFRKSGIKQRFTEHIYDAKNNKDSPLCEAIREYGPESFTKEVICGCLKDETGMWEVYCMKKYNTYHPNGYNTRILNNKDYDDEYCIREKKVGSRKNVSDTVKGHYEKLSMIKFKDEVLSLDKRPEEYIQPFRRKGQLFGYKIAIYEGRKTIMKREFGGIHIPLEESYQRALKFAQWLQTDPKDRAIDE